MANLTATISAGTSESGPVTVASVKPRGIQMPATVWTDAVLSFLGLADSGEFLPIHRDGNEVRVPVLPGIFVKLDADDFVGANQIIIRSGTKDAPVNQTVTANLILTVE